MRTRLVSQSVSIATYVLVIGTTSAWGRAQKYGFIGKSRAHCGVQKGTAYLPDGISSLRTSATTQGIFTV